MSARADAPRAALRWVAGIRLDEVLVLQGAPFLGAAFALATGAAMPARVLACFVAASCLLVAHVFALNDWSEMAEAPRAFPLDRGETRTLWLVLLASSLALFALLGVRPFLLASSIALLSAIYSATPRLGKGSPVLCSVLHLVGGALHFLLGYSLRGALDSRSLLLAGFVGLTFTAGHLTQEVRDRDDDLRNGIRTNAVAFGKVPAFVAGLILFTTADALLCALALQGLAPRRAAAATIVLYPLHLAWSLRTLASGLSSRDLRRLQWKYRARYAAIGIITGATLLL